MQLYFSFLSSTSAIWSNFFALAYTIYLTRCKGWRIDRPWQGSGERRGRGRAKQGGKFHALLRLADPCAPALVPPFFRLPIPTRAAANRV